MAVLSRPTDCGCGSYLLIVWSITLWVLHVWQGIFCLFYITLSTPFYWWGYFCHWFLIPSHGNVWGLESSENYTLICRFSFNVLISEPPQWKRPCYLLDGFYVNPRTALNMVAMRILPSQGFNHGPSLAVILIQLCQLICIYISLQLPPLWS
jgi:hypothetical protein